MQSNNLQNLENTSSDDEPVQMTTLYLTSTDWTQATVWVESGKVQLPETTIYSYLQPIEMASYPDPIMSATGANLQYLLGQEHARASQSTMVNEGESSAADVSVIPVTYTTEYLTTTLITIYPTDRLLEPPNGKLQRSTSMVPTSILAIETRSAAVQMSSETNTKIPTMNTVVPISVTKPTSSVELDLLGRGEPPGNIVSRIFESNHFHNEPHMDSPPANTSQDTLTILIYVLSAVLITSLLIHILLTFRDRRDSTDLSYTTKPPRPGLRKRLSLSISMTTGRRPSIVSTSSTEATYVSGNAVSIGKAGGKGIGNGNKESEVRRTPSMPLLDV